MTISRMALLALLGCLSLSAWGQSPSMDTKDNREVLRMGLYPPDILMRQQQRLGITAEQRRAIVGHVKAFQADVAELQWEMPSDQQALRTTLNSYPVDAEAALAQAQAVLEKESRFKQAHFRLLIAIKNELTEEQVTMINTEIKRRLQSSDRAQR